MENCKKMKKSVIITIIAILSLIIILFLIRSISPKELDDVSPEIPCPEIEKYNVNTFYVIPNFNNHPISENQSWCNYILSLNKTIQIHGINHSPYRELIYENLTQENLTFALNEFQKCFNQTPEKFKPPQLKISEENKKLIRENNLEIKLFRNSLFHKVYHCNDSGLIKNKWIKLF